MRKSSIATTGDREDLVREIQPVHIEMKLEISYLKLDHYLQLLHHGVGPEGHLVLTVRCLDTKIHT